MSLETIEKTPGPPGNDGADAVIAYDVLAARVRQQLIDPEGTNRLPPLYVKKIAHRQVVEYKLGEDGKPIKDEKGNPIILRTYWVKLPDDKQPPNEEVYLGEGLLFQMFPHE